MEFEEEQNAVPGCVPEFGAIFMSNSITKEECFRRKLLGLPSGLAQFVKQVRAGMFLFLFQFERRELHGVYQASSDGAMNIVPHAFSSSGKQFPAQVKFTPLWLCSPLCEDEFSVAIEENYYSAKKFHFGLSENQVHKLLCLFSVKKLKPQKFFTRQKVDRDSASKFRRAAVDERGITSNQAEVKPDADSNHRSFLSDYSGARLGNGGRAIDDVQFPMSGMDRQPLPYDPDAPGIDSSYSSSYECNFIPVQNFSPPHNSNAKNVFPSSENQSFLPYVEPISTMRCQDFSSGLGYCVPMAAPNHYENAQRTSTSKPVLEAAYSKNMNTNSSENVGYRGFSLSRPSPGLVPFSQSGKSDENEGTSYSFSPSVYPSFVFDYGSCKASEATIDQGMPQGGLNGAIADNVAMLRMGKPHLQGCDCCVDHHDNSSLKPDTCENLGGMYSRKIRKSVFSRLALAPKVHIKENETFVDDDEDDMDGSVDELMSMLQQSHYQWFKMSKRRQLIKGDATIYWKRRQTTSNSKLLEDDLKETSAEGRMDDIPVSADNGNQFAEKTLFLDFKRRSELQKNHAGAAKIGGSSGSGESEGGLRKRRKLIRPDFSNSNLVVPHLIAETRGPPSVSCEDSSSAVKGLTTRDSTFDGSLQDLNNTAVKESSQNVGIATVVSSIPCEEKGYITEEGLVSEDWAVNGLSQDLGSSTNSFEQDSLLEACKSCTNGIASGEIECSRSMQQSCQNADFDGERALNMATDSGNEMASMEVVASGFRGCQMDVQQTADTENGVHSSSVKSLQGIASQSQATKNT